MTTEERIELLRSSPEYAAFEKRDPKRNGWSVASKSLSGGSRSCGLPHSSWISALGELVFGVDGHALRWIVDHDREMRRWGYLVALIEPTLEEMKQLPRYHRNFIENREDAYIDDCD